MPAYVEPPIPVAALNERPRVLMLVGSPAFERVWADAAATGADVVRLAMVDPLRGEPTAIEGLRRDAARADTYDVFRRKPRSTSALRRRVDRRRLADQLTRATQHLQREEGPFDLVHGHFSAAGQLVSGMARAIGVPFVITEHSTSFSGRNASNRASRAGLARARRVCAEAAAVLPVSAQLQRAMEESGIRANYTVLPNPVDTTEFRSPEQLPPSSTIEVVSVGRLAPVKGHDLLLEAIARIRGDRPNVRLTIVGAGPERVGLEATASALGLDDVVTFTGPLPHAEVAAQLERSHAFVLASHWENLSVAVLEACVVGLPAVVTQVGGIAEVEAEGLRIVPPGDLDALTDALDDVLGHLPDLATRQRWASAAHERFSVEAVGTRLTAIYEEVRCQRPTPRGTTRR